MSDMDCWNTNCNAKVCLDKRQEQQHRERGTTFYCAAGHSQVFRPSENKKLKNKISRLEEELQRVQSNRDYWERQAEGMWKCPFGGCYYTCWNKGVMSKHIRKDHASDIAALKLLPADAGPDALNTTVH